jgi:hypothetical protein
MKNITFAKVIQRTTSREFQGGTPHCWPQEVRLVNGRQRPTICRAPEK